MANRILRIRLENTRGFAYEKNTQFTIIKHNDGTYHLKYTWTNEDLEKETFKKQLLASEVENILSLLSNLTIPAFPEHHMGCDGSFTELEVGGYAGMSHYRWWSAPPIGWEKLDEITQNIISLTEPNNVR